VKIGITCYPTYGGSGAVATELGLALAGRGHEVHFVTYAQPFRLVGLHERVFYHEVEMEDYPLFEHPPYSLALAVALHDAARREGLDLLHMHYAIPHATAAYLAREMYQSKRYLPFVTTLHGTDITLVGQEQSFFSITKFSIEQSDAVTAVSEFLRAETYRAFGCSGCEISVIPNFVNPAEYYPGPAGEPGQLAGVGPPGAKVVMHVSNFREVKRLPDVVRVFAKIRAVVPAVLVLVGDGPERPGAEAEAERLGVKGDVRFLGKLDSVAELLRSADLFLLPSETESFGLAALEAMACGVPVVATRVGGLPEVVVHGETGVLAPVGAVDTMASAALQLLCDPERARKARDSAVRRAASFSAERIVPMYEDLYRRVLER